MILVFKDTINALEMQQQYLKFTINWIINMDKTIISPSLSPWLTFLSLTPFHRIKMLRQCNGSQWHHLKTQSLVCRLWKEDSGRYLTPITWITSKRSSTKYVMVVRLLCCNVSFIIPKFIFINSFLLLFLCHFFFLLLLLQLLLLFPSDCLLS